VDAVLNPEYEVKIALVGKYAGLADSYVSMNEALRHGGAACKTKINITYIEAEEFEKDPKKTEALKDFDGIFIPYGFGPRGTEGKMMAIRFARENNIPFWGYVTAFNLQ
jgi:CTP synthase